MNALTLVDIGINGFILGTLGLVLVYAAVAGTGAIIRLAVSIYTGLVLAMTFGEALSSFIASQSLAGAFAPDVQSVKISLLILPVILLQLGHHRLHGVKQHNLLLSLVLGLLVAFLGVASVFEQLGPETRQQLVDESNLASLIHGMYLWWVGLTPLAIGLAAFLHPHHRGAARGKH